MEKFQNHKEIDKIVVVCLSGWESYLECYAQQYGITKLETVVEGGSSGFESIQNGLNAISSFSNDDDIVLIHDGNRPCVSFSTITECIKTAKVLGPAITCIPTNEVVFNVANSTPEMLNRDQIIRTQTPHAANFGYMKSIYQEAKEKGITDAVAFCSLLSILKKDINFVQGSEKNFKITYKDDIDMFKGLVQIGEFDDLLQ